MVTSDRFLTKHPSDVTRGNRVIGIIVVASVWIDGAHGFAGGGRTGTGAPERHTCIHELDTEVTQTRADLDGVVTGNMILLPV